jgi:hypothetical protein
MSGNNTPALEAPTSISVVSDTDKARFNRLRDKWKSERGPESSTTRLVMHPTYQMIIGMGPQIIPLLLRELEQQVDAWFWALQAITEEDPVPQEHRGNWKEMAKAWLAWGKTHGYKW